MFKNISSPFFTWLLAGERNRESSCEIVRAARCTPRGKPRRATGLLLTEHDDGALVGNITVVGFMLPSGDNMDRCVVRAQRLIRSRCTRLRVYQNSGWFGGGERWLVSSLGWCVSSHRERASARAFIPSIKNKSGGWIFSVGLRSCVLEWVEDMVEAVGLYIWGVPY